MTDFLLKERAFRTCAESKGDVAIIGMACRFPGAADCTQFWENLADGVNSIREIPSSRWDQSKYYSPDGGEGKSRSKWCGLVDDIDQFDAQFFNISPREACDMDPQQRLLLEEALHCIEDSGLSLRELQRHRTGVFIGHCTGDYQQISSSDDIRKDVFAVLGNYKSVLSNRISHLFNFTGPSLSIDSACASSLVAVHEGCEIPANR
jgi:acyl transferase domain-containing protein